MGYIDQARLEPRLYGGAAYFGVDEADWDALLDDLIDEASDEVDAMAGQSFGSSPPSVIRKATVKLTRAELHDIREQGLSSESDAAGNQQSYLDPGAIRDDVRDLLKEAGYYETGASGAGIDVPEVR